MKTRSLSQSDRRSQRRGNVLVLVAGILVLLVIVGSSYLSRTRAERRMSNAQRNAARSDDTGRSIGGMLASELAGALFPRPIDPNALDWLGLGTTENPNWVRLPIPPAAPRYGVDRDYTGVGRPDLWWNTAAYSTVPFTNWPDGFIDPNTGSSPRPDDIPGNPGTNDNRWLSDIEPARWNPLPIGLGMVPGENELGADGVLGTPDIVEYFSHWQHFSNPMRPGNGWVVVPFINNIDFWVGNITNLGNPGMHGTPFEQWQPHTTTGTPAFPGQPGAFLPFDFAQNGTANQIKNYITNANDFEQRWLDWFGDYQTTMQAGNLGIPGNYYRLADCIDNGGGPLEFGERPQDAFINGTPRWYLERTLADADGDGFTDSFWFLAPTPVIEDLRTLVAMRVVDLSTMINVTTATQFVRGRPDTPLIGQFNHGTRGTTPADVALGEMAVGAGPNFDSAFSSFLTNSEHSEFWYPDDAVGVFGGNGLATSAWGTHEVFFNQNQWNFGVPSVLRELGVSSTDLSSPLVRLDYWRRSGLRPFDPAAPDPNSIIGFGNNYTPFTLADELELRMYGGSNVPWSLSPLERAFQTNSTTGAILRANLDREETQEYLKQLDVRGTANFPFDEPLHNLRRMMTTFNGTRNETMAPWMWWENRWNNPSFFSQQGLQRFLSGSRLKLDLREERSVGVLPDGVLTMAQKLPWQLVTALLETPPTGPTGFNHYYRDVDTALVIDDPSFPGSKEYEATLRLGAGLAANMLSYRDLDTGYVDLETEAVTIPLVPAGGVVPPGQLGTVHPTLRYLGMELQPFLVEVFLGHVHRSESALLAHPANAGMKAPLINPGDNVVALTGGGAGQVRTIVAVQIANPYDKRMFLEDGAGNSLFSITVFGEAYELFGVLDPGQSRVYYSLPATLGPKYLDALDLEGPLDIEDTVGAPTGWSIDRATYDLATNEERAVELTRVIPNLAANANVVIDRIDVRNHSGTYDEDLEFGETVATQLWTDAPKGSYSEPAGAIPWPNVMNIGDTNDRWIQWVRVSREWDDDMDNDGVVDDNERAPRYVFSLREVSSKTQGDGFLSTDPLPDAWFEDATMLKPTKFLPEDAAGATIFSLTAPQDKDVTLPTGPGADEFINVSFAFQMLQKDGDFEQIGEILNVFTYGHMLKFTSGTDMLDVSGDDGGTPKTFSEHMIDGAISGMDLRVNRLRVMPTETRFQSNDYIHSGVVGIVPQNGLLGDPRHLQPELPAGARVFDMFVCDGPGWNWQDLDPNGNSTFGDREDRMLLTFGNAAGFSGKATPGLINLQAPREVLQALPHMSRLVHEANVDTDLVNPNVFLNHLDPLDPLYQYNAGRIRVPEAIETYREGLGNPYAPAASYRDFHPAYGGRGLRSEFWTVPPSPIPDIQLDLSRGARGFASIGEVAMLSRVGRSAASGDIVAQWARGFGIDAVAKNHLRDAQFANDVLVDNDLSIDVQDVFDPVNGILNDEVSGDAEEANMLFAGISNLITTRGDAFAIWYKVRTVRQDPTTGLWDGTNPEFIVDEARYLMIVDRSQVNTVTDQPRILLHEKLPD